MNVKLRVLSAGVLFFIGGTIAAQKTKKDTTNKETQIEEVIMVGYTKKSVSSLTGSVNALKAADIDNPSAISVDQALQGKVPGVVVNTTSGTPGAFQDIRIRGVGSFTASNSPLFVIDGVPMINGNTSADNASSTPTLSTLSALASINNDDIESIVVLKDAASTAIYGARGSNGVIVITTKRGSKGKTRFNLDTSVGFQNEAFNKLKMLSGSQRLNLLKNGIANQFNQTQEQAMQTIIDNDLGGYSLWDGNEYGWQDLLTKKNAGLYSVNLNASGGDAKSIFYASLGYNKTESTSIANPFERITGLFSYKRDLTDKASFESSFTGSWLKQNPILEAGSFYGNPYLTRVLISPWINPYNSDGSYNIDEFSDMTSIANTLYTQANNVIWQKQMRALINSKIDYKIIKNITFTSRLNVDFLFNDYKSYNNRYHGDAKNENGSSERRMSQNFNLVSVNQLNYLVKFDKHRIDASAFFEYQKNQLDVLSGYGENIPADGLTNIDNTSANYSTGSSYEDWKNTSYFGTLNYSYNNKYVLDATIRREGSSRFASGNRFGTFWSIGGAWNIHKENFLPDAINELKLRSSYGITGNNGVGLNRYQATLAYDIAYGQNGGAYANNFGNPDLTWEKSKTYDIGLDFAFFDSRISGSIEYYNRYTYDLLQNVPLSRTTSFTSQAQNLGAMRNQGVEASLKIDIIRSNSFNWNIFGSIGTVNNRIEKLATGGDGLPIDVNAGSVYRKAEIGQPFMSWYMPTWAGVNTQTGAPEWYLNGVDGERTSNYNLAKRTFQGTAIPKYTGGFGTGLSYKNIFLNANFYYAGGHKIYEQYAQFYMRTNSFTLANYNGSEDLLDAWQKPGDDTDVPKLSYSKNDNFHATSSRHLYDGSFIRLKDITIGYNLPKDFTKNIGIDGLALTLRGTNLWTYVFDKGLKLDPEVSAAGFTTLTTPPVKSIIFGVNVQF